MMFDDCSRACACFQPRAAVDQRRGYRATPSRHPASRKLLRAGQRSAPALAARVAAILRTPCADPTTPVVRHASLHSLPNDSLVKGRPLPPQSRHMDQHRESWRGLAVSAVRPPFRSFRSLIIVRSAWTKSSLRCDVRYARSRQPTYSATDHEDRELSRSSRSEGSLSAVRRGGDGNHAD